MANTYTIELSDAEQKAMEYVAVDVNDWIQNAVHNRARIAIDEMVAIHVNEKLTKGEPISGTKEDIAMKSDLPNAQTRNEENLKNMPGPRDDPV